MNRNTFRSRSMLALPGVGFHMLCVAALGLMLSSGLRADSSQSTPTIVAQLGLVSPIGVAVDGSGNVYVADYAGQQILKVAWTGSMYGAPQPLLATPASVRALALDASGNLYYLDDQAATLMSISASQLSPNPIVPVTPVAVARDPRWSRPVGLAINTTGGAPSGQIYVADASAVWQVVLPTPAVVRSNPKPAVLTNSQKILGGIRGPVGLAVDTSGNLFVVESGIQRAVELPWTGSNWGAPVTLLGSMSRPMYAALDAGNDLYVADMGNNRVIEIPYGVGASAYTTEITVLSAWSGSGLDAPQSVALDGVGNLYVADTAHGRVLKLAVQTQPTTAIPASSATAIGLAVAAQYNLQSDSNPNASFYLQTSSARTRWNNYQDAVVLALLNQYYAVASNLGQSLEESDFAACANLAQNQLNLQALDVAGNAQSIARFNQMDAAGRLRYAIDMLSINLPRQTSLSAALVQALYDLEKTKFSQLETPFDPARKFPADPQATSLSVNAMNFIHQQVLAVADLAATNAQFAAIVNPILLDLTGFNESSSYSAIQAAYGNLTTLEGSNAAAQPLLPALDSPDGGVSYALEPEQLKSQADAAVSSYQNFVDIYALQPLQAEPATGITALGVDTSKGMVLSTTCMSNPVDKTSPSFALGGAINSYCSGAESLLSGIGDFVSVSNSNVAAQAIHWSSFAVSVASSVGEIAVGFENPAAWMTGVGNILSSVFGVSGLGGGESSDQQIMDQIGSLSNQVKGLQSDMDTQFATVDQSLTGLTALAQQDISLVASLKGDVNQLGKGILDAQTQLNQEAYYNSFYAEAQAQDAIMQSANECIQYRAKHNNSDIGQSAFDWSCEEPFFNFSQTDAATIWDPTPPGSAYGPSASAVYDTFQDFANPNYTACSQGCPTPFAVLTNYLNLYPEEALSQPSASDPSTWTAQSPLSASGAPLVNPVEWTLGARGYLEMAHEFPQYAVNRATWYLDQLVQSGTSVQQAAQNVTSTRDSNGNVQALNQALWTLDSSDCTTTPCANTGGLLAHHQNAITSLHAALANELTDFETTSTPNGNIALFAGPNNQPAPPVPALNTIPACSARVCSSQGCYPPSLANPPLLPASTINLYGRLPREYLLAEELSPGSLSVCYQAWMNASEAQEQVQKSIWSTVFFPWSNSGGASCMPGSYMPSSLVPQLPRPGDNWYWDTNGLWVDSCTLAPMHINLVVQFQGTDIFEMAAKTPDPVAAYEMSWASASYCMTHNTDALCRWHDSENDAFVADGTNYCNEFPSHCWPGLDNTDTNHPNGYREPRYYLDAYQELKPLAWENGRTINGNNEDLLQILTSGNVTVEDFTSASTQAAQADVSGAFASLQQAFYSKVAADFNASTDLQQAGEQVSGAKSLLQAYASLGLPNSMQTNGVLHGWLFGSCLPALQTCNVLEDGTAIQNDFTAFSTLPVANTLVNQADLEVAKLSNQLRSFAAALQPALTRIQANNLPESLSMVDITLDDLKAFESLQTASNNSLTPQLSRKSTALSPCEYKLSQSLFRVATEGGSSAVTLSGIPFWIDAGKDQIACRWNAVVSAPSWLQVTPRSSSGPSNVKLTAARNLSGKPRAATVLLGGKLLRVYQSAK